MGWSSGGLSHQGDGQKSVKRQRTDTILQYFRWDLFSMNSPSPLVPPHPVSSASIPQQPWGSSSCSSHVGSWSGSVTVLGSLSPRLCHHPPTQTDTPQDFKETPGWGDRLEADCEEIVRGDLSYSHLGYFLGCAVTRRCAEWPFRCCVFLNCGPLKMTVSLVLRRLFSLLHPNTRYT